MGHCHSLLNAGKDYRSVKSFIPKVILININRKKYIKMENVGKKEGMKLKNETGIDILIKKKGK